MKSNKNLVLVGMMGSGKSTVGSLISKKLNANFIDIDNLIEKNTNMSIAEIFRQKGEDYFRNLEQQITLKELNSSNNIIALGGGAFINYKIRKEILTNNVSFWLSCGNQTLLNRIKSSKKRPIAFNLNDKQLLKLIEEREKIYLKAHFKINCHKLTKTEIVKKILKLYEFN